MRGHITQKGNKKGSYYIKISLGKDPSTGKYKCQWITVRGTKKDAERRLSELLHQLDTGSFVRPSKISLSEYLEKWLNEYAWANLGPRTAEGYSQIIRGHISPSLGNIPLTDLKPAHLQGYYSEKLENGRSDGKGALSARTVRHHHMVLHDALKHAVKWGLLSRNVADAVSTPRCQRPEWHTLSEDDIHNLLEAAKGIPYYDLFYLAIYTGMRRSEILALRWCDVDLTLCQAYVTRSLHRLKTGEIVIRPPKTGKGRRNVALTPSTTLLLKKRLEKRITEMTALGSKVQEENLIFSDLEGRPLLPDSVTQAWRRVTRQIGINGVRLHDARHSHASLLLKQGVHPKVVQERLGHASIQTTLDTYSHVVPGLQEMAAANFDQMLSLRREKEPVKKISRKLVENTGGWYN